MVPLWENEQVGAQVVRLAEPSEIGELVSLFEGIAQRESWQPGGALRLWQDRSVYFGLELEGQLAGGLQLVLPDERGTFPCQNVWPEVAVEDPACSVHVSIMALEEQYRGQSALFWLLAAEMWRYCVGEGIGHLLIEVTPRVLPIYQRMGWPLVICGEKRLHWGEDCYLCSMAVSEVTSELVRRSSRSMSYRAVATQAFRLQEESGEYWAIIDPPKLRMAA